MYKQDGTLLQWIILIVKIKLTFCDINNLKIRYRYLASSLNSLAKSPGGGLGVERVRHEQVLRSVDDEGTTTHIAADTKER